MGEEETTNEEAKKEDKEVKNENEGATPFD